MDTIQFSLFFAALLIAYILVHIRLTRFETYLREIVGLKLLNERLKGVSDVLERVRLDRVEEQLGQVHDDLVALGEATTKVERAVGRAASIDASALASARAPVADTPAGVVRSLVESRLLSLGYRDLRIISDLREVQIEEETEILVECERDGMRHKGRVVTRNGSIVDVQLQSSAQTFT